jgi:hypothetical protein
MGFGVDVYGQAMWSGDPRKIRHELVRINDEVLMPALPHYLCRFTQKDWQRLARQLQITWDGAERILIVYGNKLDPAVVGYIMDLQDAMWKMMQAYATFPDIYGVPDEELTPNVDGKSSLPLKRQLEQEATAYACQILRLSSALLTHVGSLPVTE